MNIFISGINRPLGFQLSEVLRRDHIMLDNYPKIFGSLYKTHYSQLNSSIFNTYNVNSLIIILVLEIKRSNDEEAIII